MLGGGGSREGRIWQDSQDTSIIGLDLFCMHLESCSCKPSVFGDTKVEPYMVCVE